jgi:hypothetical protein
MVFSFEAENLLTGGLQPKVPREIPKKLHEQAVFWLGVYWVVAIGKRKWGKFLHDFD